MQESDLERQTKYIQVAINDVSDSDDLRCIFRTACALKSTNVWLFVCRQLVDIAFLHWRLLKSDEKLRKEYLTVVCTDSPPIDTLFEIKQSFKRLQTCTYREPISQLIVELAIEYLRAENVFRAVTSKVPTFNKNQWQIELFAFPSIIIRELIETKIIVTDDFNQHKFLDFLLHDFDKILRMPQADNIDWKFFAGLVARATRIELFGGVAQYTISVKLVAQLIASHADCSACLLHQIAVDDFRTAEELMAFLFENHSELVLFALIGEMQLNAPLTDIIGNRLVHFRRFDLHKNVGIKIANCLSINRQLLMRKIEQLIMLFGHSASRSDKRGFAHQCQVLLNLADRLDDIEKKQIGDECLMSFLENTSLIMDMDINDERRICAQFVIERLAPFFKTNFTDLNFDYSSSKLATELIESFDNAKNESKDLSKIGDLVIKDDSECQPSTSLFNDVDNDVGRESIQQRNIPDDFIRFRMPKTPVYIRECVKQLDERDDYQMYRVAWLSLNSLLDRRVPGALDLADQLAFDVLRAQNLFADDDFDQIREEIIVTLCRIKIETVPPVLANAAFNKELTLLQRLDAVRLLANAARTFAQSGDSIINTNFVKHAFECFFAPLATRLHQRVRPKEGTYRLEAEMHTATLNALAAIGMLAKNSPYKYRIVEHLTLDCYFRFRDIPNALKSCFTCLIVAFALESYNNLLTPQQISDIKEHCDTVMKSNPNDEIRELAQSIFTAFNQNQQDSNDLKLI